MKLFYSNTSPYSRKARLVMIEKGLHEQIEEVLVNPFDDNAELKKVNPLGKIPVLVFENSESLFDSPVICRYLDSLPSDRSTLIPDSMQWSILRWEALADGMMDAIYNIVMERRRPTSEQSHTWIARWVEDVSSVLMEMEAGIDKPGTTITLAHIAVGVSVGYLELRLPNLMYESTCPQVAMYPKLLAWYEKFKTHPSMLATRPQD